MRAAAALLAVLAVLLLGAAPAAAEPEAPVAERDTGLRLDVTGVGPRIVTADSSTLVVTGQLTNTGPSAVSAIGVRVQRSDPLRTEAAVRDALAGDDAADAVTPDFTDLPDLAPGASAPVTLSVPLTGPAASTLALTRVGVHALLVNVNATRDGVRSRMAAVRMLLPVLGLPGQPGAPDPHPTTVLYPLVDPPRRLPTVPGEPVTLTDDDLAASFAPGGRLDGLVDALATRAPVGSPLRAGVCVAVDPELVETASQMSGGYQVRAAEGTLTPGAGADAARAWLAKTSTTLRGSCVLALPQSDADLVALVRSGASDLAARAVADGRRIAGQLLGTPVLADTVWPVAGALDEPTLQDVATAEDGSSAVVLAADALDQGGAARTAGVLPIAGPDRNTTTTAVLTDPLLTEAATGAGDTTASRSPAGGPGPLGAQDALGALAFRALTADPAAGPLVLAPPHEWRIDGQGAAALLEGVGRLISTGAVEPRALGASVAAGPAPEADRERLVYPLRIGAQEIPPAVVRNLTAARDDVERLRAASDYEVGVGAPPDQVFDPLLRGLLRGASAQWRGRPAEAAAQADLVSARIGELVGSVRVLQPPGPFSLGTRDAPVPLTVANGLPITMTVRVELTSTAGLRVAPIPVQRVPPLGRVQVRVNAEVLRAGQFTVEAAVRTPDGGALGEPTRLQVRSTVYGTVTIWLTAAAGALLVLLAGRRIWRRIRGDRSGSGPDGGTGGGPSGPSGPDGPPPPPARPAPPMAVGPPHDSSTQVRRVMHPAGPGPGDREVPAVGPHVTRRGMSSADGDLP
ncbi:DUF6049 family protein [Pseudonocardia xishanensis]|uniref:DUF6049 family protein n=1 Tax=Pseudonocardia xishanensis TaxID=630995 RepID=A0ABP8RLX8_9PSEU